MQVTFPTTTTTTTKATSDDFDATPTPTTIRRRRGGDDDGTSRVTLPRSCVAVAEDVWLPWHPLTLLRQRSLFSFLGGQRVRLAVGSVHCRQAAVNQCEKYSSRVYMYIYIPESHSPVYHTYYFIYMNYNLISTFFVEYPF